MAKHTTKDKLATYASKRDFTRTMEPAPTETRRKRKALEYVIQKHDASRLHYDLRLEVDGVMKSWAVPKGPSLDPGTKRLAVEVEDHPLDYNRFEGTIPEGEYGGGTVMIWDRGTWRYTGDAEDPAAALKQGTLEFTLAGKRLKGGWVLVRTRKVGRSQQWLLIKRDDQHADPDHDVTERFVTSAVSRKSMEQIGKGRGARGAGPR